MWKTHGPRQRTLLIIAAVVLLALGAVLAFGRQLADLVGLDLPSAPMDVIGWHDKEAAGLLVGLGIVVFLVCLWVLLAALPNRPSAPTYRYRAGGADEGEGLTEIDSSVIARAGQDSAEAHPELTGAHVRISGGSDAPVLYARYTLRADADPVAAMDLVTGTLVPELETALGVPFTRRHVRYDVAAPGKQDARNIDLATLPK